MSANYSSEAREPYIPRLLLSEAQDLSVSAFKLLRAMAGEERRMMYS